ncbi:MAG TPA: hypothetical protein VH744_06580 [Terriglobales bacterium]|jgi:hypothetical protein
MAEDTHKHEVDFEREDLNPNSVYGFLIGLGLVCILVYFILKGMYSFLDAREKARQAPQSPLVKVETETRKVPPEFVEEFPQPRLERNERLEIRDFRLKEEQTLNSYGWVDEKAGVARIPIDRAMQLLAEQGLPTRPGVGVAPPSAVTMGREAAASSDRAEQKKKRKE